jgi:hypothetical protein
VPAGFNHPKTRTHVRLLGPCFKTGRMKPYDRQQPWHSVCIRPPDSRSRFKRTARSPLWSKTYWEERSQPKREHVPRRLCRTRARTPQAITLTEASHLLAGLFTRFQQMLTHADGKCDKRQPVTSANGPFGSVKHPYQQPPV